MGFGNKIDLNLICNLHILIENLNKIEIIVLVNSLNHKDCGKPCEPTTVLLFAKC